MLFNKVIEYLFRPKPDLQAGYFSPLRQNCLVPSVISGQSVHKWIALRCCRSEDGDQQDCHLVFQQENGEQSPLGGSPEEPRSLGRLDVLQEGNFGTGCPRGLKDESTGKKASLAE